MAKKRDGLEYFPFDVVMDDKFALIEAEFGLNGFAVLVKLLQKIYGERGYYCEWQSENMMLFSHKIGQTNELVSKVVGAAIERGIFDKEMFSSYHILTSKSIQEIYFDAASRRKENYADSRYLLLSEEELPKNVSIDGKNVNTNAKNVDINAENDDTTEQRKGKESKGKQRKAKESKGKESKGAAADTAAVEDAVRLFEQICPQLDSDLTQAGVEDIITAKQSGIDFKKLFSRINRSDFLLGKKGGTWTCSLEWVVNKSNAEKVLSGYYDNGRYHNGASAGEVRRKPSYNIAEIEAFDEFR